MLRADLDFLRGHQQVVTLCGCCCLSKMVMLMVAVADVGHNGSPKTTMTSLLESAYLFGRIKGR
jgi:hypothetical protein